jgi:cellulose biosynthesis protein BcsQ
MAGKLCCYSVHSVKGGVGKSTLSTAIAHTLALPASAAPKCS